MSAILITHTDLDGVGCEILFKKCYGKNSKVIVADYGDVDEKVYRLLEDLNPDDKLYITDLNVKPDTAKLIDTLAQDFDITLIDHHKTSTYLSGKSWAVVDLNNSMCGTKLFYNLLKDNFYDMRYYKNFVDIVDDYDRWIHIFPLSKKHNSLYYLIGREKYVDRMLSDSIMELNYAENILLEVEEARIKRYCESFRDKVLITGVEYEDEQGNPKYVNLPFIFAEQYTSELGNYLVSDEGLYIPVIAIISLKDKKVSLRSKPSFDCSLIAKHFGGGGHKNASGFQLNDSKIFNIERSIFNN